MLVNYKISVASVINKITVSISTVWHRRLTFGQPKILTIGCLQMAKAEHGKD